MRTHDIPPCWRNSRDIPIMPLVLTLWLIPISSDNPCIEHLFMVTKVFEPLKFDCNNYFGLKSVLRHHNPGLKKPCSRSSAVKIVS